MYNSSSKLRALCIKKNWFTCGGNTEYEELLNLANTGLSLEDAARRIFRNSGDWNYNVILEILKDNFKN